MGRDRYDGRRAAATRTDPHVNEFSATVLAGHIMRPGASVAVPVSEIDSYPGGGGRVFFIYRLRSGRAMYWTSIGRSGADLRLAGYRMTVPSTTFTR